ncbi:glycosyltransferase family 2 protein [Dyadobacter chenwenxiniae]|uniref:Glycosyltransferase family 2 protein n=1 Tax=Dyadobacter chenwenxiniae TaxID=2906456 RepID=A0A9X1PHC1_9BACT|nr:glycosyltransferase family 2 protein [Dyadobacter chenwenxiniae]MCF0060773.1 glycosyltransferase family 2 protein [Dyadobacter chenwenxiniae]UON80606.1 glycosyltransferase family 2 protein [Dyadobacter chenwenxiniae]
MTNSAIQISVVVPLYNEEESLPELSEWIARVMNENGFSYEVIFVDDGSKDNSWEVISNISQENPNIRGLRFVRNYGKTAALQTAFQAALGDVIITMDADLQDSPDEIPELYKMIKEDRYDLVSGWKKKRYDPITKTVPTKIFNAATRSISGVMLHDFNCGLKAYRKEVVKNITIYGEMHRYIPVIAKWNGFAKIGEKVVQHRPRKYGTTKFGLERFIFGFLDLLSIAFVNKFGRRPMHLFGSLGTLMFFLGSIIAFWLLGKKIYNIYNLQPYRNVTENPLFFLALVAIMVGSQLFLAGFLGELFVKQSVSKTGDYNISEKIGNPTQRY